MNDNYTPAALARLLIDLLNITTDEGKALMVMFAFIICFVVITIIAAVIMKLFSKDNKGD